MDTKERLKSAIVNGKGIDNVLHLIDDIDDVFNSVGYFKDEIERLNMEAKQMQTEYDQLHLDNEKMKQNEMAVAFEIQWIYQQNKIRKQTLEEKFEFIQHKINEFEMDFGDTFENLYGNLNDIQIDELDEAIDVFDWKNYITQKNFLLGKTMNKSDISI
jgi:hypoxanthine phosphoribosyltransferase